MPAIINARYLIYQNYKTALADYVLKFASQHPVSLFLAYRNKYLVYLDTLGQLMDRKGPSELIEQRPKFNEAKVYDFLFLFFLLLVVSILECSASASTSMSTSTRTQTAIHEHIVQLLEPLEPGESCELVAILQQMSWANRKLPMFGLGGVAGGGVMGRHAL